MRARWQVERGKRLFYDQSWITQSCLLSYIYCYIITLAADLPLLCIMPRVYVMIFYSPPPALIPNLTPSIVSPAFNKLKGRFLTAVKWGVGVGVYRTKDLSNHTHTNTHTHSLACRVPSSSPVYWRQLSKRTHKLTLPLCLKHTHTHIHPLLPSPRATLLKAKLLTKYISPPPPPK